MKMKFKVLLVESIHPEGVRFLKDNHVEVIQAERTDEKSLLEKVKDVDGIVIRANGRITRQIMENSPKLKIIARHGVGVDNIDVEEATKRGIYVVNSPQANTEAVAEHTIGMMISLSRRMAKTEKELRKGNWKARYEYVGRELLGKKWGSLVWGELVSRWPKSAGP